MSDPNIKEQLKKINSLTRKSVTEDDVYIFPVILCDNDVDRDNERFTVSALRDLSKMFIGKTGIFDHSMKSADQTARIFDACVEFDTSQKNIVGETYARLKAYAYMLRNEKNISLINEIEGGIKKEVSVGCSISSRKCSICGTDHANAKCSHRPGEIYGGNKCHIVLDNPTDAYEWSFVAVPAQPMAGIIKSYNIKKNTAPEFDLKTFLHDTDNEDGMLTLNKENTEKLYAGLIELSSSIDEVNDYKNQLCEEIVSLSAKAAPFFTTDFILKSISDLPLSELKTIKSALEHHCLSDNKPIKPQLYVESKRHSAYDNSQFRI